MSDAALDALRAATIDAGDQWPPKSRLDVICVKERAKVLAAGFAAVGHESVAAGLRDLHQRASKKAEAMREAEANGMIAARQER